MAPAKVGLEQIDVPRRERPFVLEEVQLDQPGRRSVEIPIHSPEEAKARRACREPQGMNGEKPGISARKHEDFANFAQKTWRFQEISPNDGISKGELESPDTCTIIGLCK